MTTSGARSASIVALRGVSKTYDNGTRALEGVDLDIREGEFLTLVGPSGCGKSTLLRLVANLSRPSDGRIAWWGESADAMIAQERRMAFVFQSPTLMPWASVATNVRLPLDLAGVSRARSTRAVDESLARVGLGNAARHLPRELSGGMQMRASIARALVTEPSLLLMDEPFGALDEFTRQRLDIELLDLWLAQRFTVVFVTHSIQEAVFLSTRVVAMAAHPGRLVESFQVDEAYPRGATFRISPSFATLAQAVSSAVAKASADALPDAAVSRVMPS
ncbi:MAG TPA: ABC transporter ATP-binding protein [Casimicrobiaceae bacterium]|nr:ABC transporter ATP-binding protein [Casimicrobiaceae bacterium]